MNKLTAQIKTLCGIAIYCTENMGKDISNISIHTPSSVVTLDLKPLCESRRVQINITTQKVVICPGLSEGKLCGYKKKFDLADPMLLPTIVKAFKYCIDTNHCPNCPSRVQKK